MVLSLGANIKRFRLQRGLTQEEVANHLGISFQSISKWERGESYPDIELLPVLSNYFGVNIDELLGVSEPSKREKYDDINNRWRLNNKNGQHRENVCLMREALRMFPNDALLLVQLSTSLEKLGGDEKEKEKHLRESIAVQEQIINYCPDCEVRGATLYNICFAYWKIGDKEKAIEQARKLPNLYKARENALSFFLEGEEKRAVSKEALAPLAWGIMHHLKSLSETENNPEYRKRAKQIIDILFEEKDEFIRRMYDTLD